LWVGKDCAFSEQNPRKCSLLTYTLRLTAGMPT